MSDSVFALIIGVVAAPIGAWVVPITAAWAPATPTPLLQPAWRAGQCAATVVTAAAVAGVFGPGARVVPLLVAVPIVVAASAVDIVTRRLPDRLVGPSSALLAVVMAVCALAAGRPGWLGGAVGGVVLLGGFLLALHLVSPAGMGFGDVKFGALLGGVLGWVHPVLAVYGLGAGSLLAAVVGGVLALARRNRRLTLAFGPFLAAGALVALVVGGALDVG